MIYLTETIKFNNTDLYLAVTAIREGLNSSANTSWPLFFNNIDDLETFESLIFFQILFPDISF